MPKFEEIQMRIAESAKNYLEIYNMQVLIEQFTLDRESKFSLTLHEMEPPFPISATVSFTYDAFQTGMTMFNETIFDENTADVDTSIDMEFSINLPIMTIQPDVESILEEIEERFPDTEPILISKHIYPSDRDMKEHEISYNYNIESENLTDGEMFDDIFEELKDILKLVYDKTSDYIDWSWYRGEE